MATAAINDNDEDDGSPTIADEDFSKLSLVRIHGLQSETGKKLNGSCGIVMSGKTSKDAAGNERFAIRIFAKLSNNNNAGGAVLVPISPTDDKKLKKENMTLDPSLENNPIFKEAAATEMERIQREMNSGNESNIKLLLWWQKCFYLKWPDDLLHGLSYASTLSKIEKHQEACKIMWEVYQEGVVSDEYLRALGPQAPGVMHECATTFAHGSKHLHEAFEVAEKIPFEDRPHSAADLEGVNPQNMFFDNKTLASNALKQVSAACDRLVGANLGEEITKEYAELRIKCDELLYERSPNDLNLLMILGGAYCTAGEKLKGARQYRKALDLHQRGGPNIIPLENVQNARTRLVLAQMECPGGKLENKYIIGGGTEPDGTSSVTFVPKEQRRMCEGIQRHAAIGVAVVPNGDVLDSTTLILPADPDDENEFAPSLLEEVRNYS